MYCIRKVNKPLIVCIQCCMYFSVFFVRQIYETKEGDILFKAGFSTSFILFPPKPHIWEVIMQ